jgi:hypothetical protein
MNSTGRGLIDAPYETLWGAAKISVKAR